MSFEDLKISKQLISALADEQIETPKEIQEKSISRINGGQDLIITGPEGCGKTMTIIIAVLSRLKYAQEEAPRALVLVPTKESVLELVDKFKRFARNSTGGLRVLGLVPGAGMEGQREDLLDGVDIVIGTPDRVQLLYYKSGINLNKVKMFVLDQTEQHIRQGLQTTIRQLSSAIPKTQHLIFSEVMHDKLELLGSQMCNYPSHIEITEHAEIEQNTFDQFIYKVPNYKTKLNLLNLLMRDDYEYLKVVVFANSKTTVENLYKSLERRIAGEVAVFESASNYIKGYNSVEDFISSEQRVLLVGGDKLGSTDLTGGLSHIIHFDIPLEKELFLSRIILPEDAESETLTISFVSDLELNQIKKAENEIGFYIPVEDLPLSLIIEGDAYSSSKKQDADEFGEVKKKETPASEETGSAFHDKKAKNAKDYNYGYKDKLKMFGRKNRPNKKLK